MLQFHLWNELIPEMQATVSGHLDRYSCQALALTSATEWAKWGVPNLRQRFAMDDLEHYAAEPYVHRRWQSLQNFEAALTGMAKREDTSLFFHYARELVSRPLQRYDYNITACNALIRASNPSVFKLALSKHPDIFKTENFMKTPMSWALLDANPPDPAMVPLVRAISGPFELVWNHEFIMQAIHVNKIAFLFRMCELDISLRSVMQDTRTLELRLSHIAHNLKFPVTFWHVRVYQSLLDLMERYTFSNDLYITMTAWLRYDIDFDPISSRTALLDLVGVLKELAAKQDAFKDALSIVEGLCARIM